MMIPVTALVFSLVAWINGTGLIEPAWPVAPLVINPTDEAGMVQDINRCYDTKGAQRPAPEVATEMVGRLYAIYCANKITYIVTKVDMATPGGQAVLVHELVHWLQEYNGEAEAASCMPALERNAYAVGWEWQEQQGLPRFPDAFTVMMRSTCSLSGGN